MSIIQTKSDELVGGVVKVPKSCFDGGYLPVVIAHNIGTAYLHHLPDNDRTQSFLSSLPANHVTSFGHLLESFPYEVYYIIGNPDGECAPAEEASPEVHALMEKIVDAMNASGLYHF